MTVFLIVVLCLAVLFLFCIFPSLRRHPDRKELSGLYIAHRGLHNGKEAPENSIEAFSRAAEFGFAIENDIHLTRDGEVVVFHDDTLNRVCGVDGKVEEMTLEELKNCRLLGTEYTIPTLKECLDAVDGKVPLLVEFKCRGVHCRELCEAADKILSKYKGKYFIQSFYPTVLRWYKHNRKEVLRGQLATPFKGETITRQLSGALLFSFLGRPDFVSYEHKYRKYLFFCLSKFLGALPVGWTFKSQNDLDKDKQGFKAYIFEGFWPEE